MTKGGVNATNPVEIFMANHEALWVVVRLDDASTHRARVVYICQQLFFKIADRCFFT